MKLADGESYMRFRSLLAASAIASMSRAARKQAYASAWKSFIRALAEVGEDTIEEEDDDDDEDDDVEDEESEDRDNDDDEGIELGLRSAVYSSKASKHRVNRGARPSAVSK
jgi:TATA-binding protein-associated factor Taf7